MFEQVIKEADNITQLDEKIDHVMEFYRNNNTTENYRRVRDWLHVEKTKYKEEREYFTSAIEILDSYKRGR